MIKSITLTILLAISIAFSFVSIPTNKTITAIAKPNYSTLSKLSTQEAKDKYGWLNPSEKREVWRAKLSDTDVTGWNQTQIKFLKSVIASLDSLRFDGTDSSNVAGNYSHSIKLFGKAEAKRIFSSIGNTVSLQKVGGFASCECRVSEDFCSGTSIPWKCVLYACDGHIGCGWLWTGYCNGMCEPEGSEN